MLSINSIEVNGRIETCKAVNLLIGPNNSGKSTLLREISSNVSSLNIQENNLWLSGVSLRIDNPKEDVRNLFPKINFDSVGDIEQYRGDKFLDKTGFRLFRPNITQSGDQYFNVNLIQDYANLDHDNSINFSVDSSNTDELTSRPNFWFFRLMSATGVIEEFCDSRLQAQLSANVQDILTQGNETIIHHLLSDPEQLELIRDNIRTVFNIEIGFDNLQQGQKALRIMPDTKIRNTENRKQDAKQWSKHSPLLQSQGDGIRAYLKLIFSLLDSNRSLVFIDEPEAFLHPPQRRQLGALVAKLAKDNKKQVFISTHDSEFLRGALSATKDIKVFNLKKSKQGHDVQTVEISDFRALTNSQPEILNERILNSFFYKKTIITESETDRVFYEHVSALYHWQLFQNKNFIGLSGVDKALNLFEKLRELDLNAAVIIDIDFLVTRRYPPHLADNELMNLHNDFKQKFNNSYSLHELKKKGVAYLRSVDEELSLKLITLLKKYAEKGVYIPDVGELESWSGSKKNDLEQMISYVTTARRRKIAKFTKDALA